MLLTEKNEVDFGKCTEEDDSAFQAKDCEASPTKKKHFYHSFGLMQGAGRRGKSKPFSVLVLDRILLFLIFAGKTVELSDTEVQLQFSGLTVKDNYVLCYKRWTHTQTQTLPLLLF